LAAQIDSVRTRPLKAKTALWMRVMTGWGTERRRGWKYLKHIHSSLIKNSLNSRQE